MYYGYYQLKENPFNITADPDFFFSSKYHQEAISNLRYGITYRKGIIVITGEIGTGKTTLCRQLLKQSDNKIKFGLILNPKFSELQLLHMIAYDLGLCPKQKNKFAIIQVLNDFLIKESTLGNNVALVIDEAQNLGVKQLEQVRLLSNLETEKEKLLQIILIGQPELLMKLELPELRQLNQRVTVYYQLKALDQFDIKDYIVHRLVRAMNYPQGKQRVYFTDAAIQRVYHHTQGIPRVINILCDRALLAGFVAEKNVIDERIIDNCAKELNW